MICPRHPKEGWPLEGQTLHIVSSISDTVLQLKQQIKVLWGWQLFRNVHNSLSHSHYAYANTQAVPARAMAHSYLSNKLSPPQNGDPIHTLIRKSSPFHIFYSRSHTTDTPLNAQYTLATLIHTHQCTTATPTHPVFFFYVDGRGTSIHSVGMWVLLCSVCGGSQSKPMFTE